MAPVFENSWEMSTVESYCPVSLLSVLSKTFEKLVNNKFAEHHEKCGLISKFQYGFSKLDIFTPLYRMQWPGE